MLGWVSTNSFVVGSRVKPCVPPPRVNTSVVVEEYRQYPAARSSDPGWRTERERDDASSPSSGLDEAPSLYLRPASASNIPNFCRRGRARGI